MKVSSRIATVAFAAGMLTIGVMPAAHAAPIDVDVYGGTTAEYRKTCSTQEPFVCGTFTNVASGFIQAYGNINSPITVGYEFYSGTAIAGVDFTGPFTGTVVLQPSNPYASASVPVVNDGIAEPTETLHVRITSVSQNADIGPPADIQIFDGGNMPMDCDPARTFSSASITCTGRPGGQQWRVTTSCDRGESWPNPWTRLFTVYGTTITGNGTSSVTCPNSLYNTGPAWQKLS